LYYPKIYIYLYNLCYIAISRIMKKTLLFLLFMALFFPVRAQLSDVRPDVWLRADKFDYKDKIWKDLSGNNRHASKTHGNSLFTDSLVNDNPAVYFNGVNTTLQIDYEPESAVCLTIFTVYQSSGEHDQGVWHATLGDDYDTRLTTQRVMNLQKLRRYAGETALFPVVNLTEQTHNEPVKKLKGYIRLGGGDALTETGVYEGKIAECIIFYRELTHTEKLIVQSYLALKYGVTLMYSDYLDGKGNTVWSYEQNNEYPYSIAGIGRDDSTSLYRKQSVSSEQDNILSVAATGFFETNTQNTTTIDNSHYLIWSDNGAALSIAFLKNSPYKLLGRKWLMTGGGENIPHLPTGLTIDTKNFFDTEKDSLLYIAVSSTGDPTFKDAAYIAAGSIDLMGRARFDDLRWDVDRSGNDLFTFAALPKKQYANSDPDEPTNVVPEENYEKKSQTPLYEYILYPNPTSGAYTLQLSFAEPTEVTVNLFNQSGAKIKQFYGNNNSTYRFTGYLAQAGCYLIKIENSYKTEVMKLIVAGGD